MNVEEKLELIKLLSELNGLIIINKIKGINDEKNLERVKRIAKKLMDENVYDFDFSSDEKFEESLNLFLSNVN